MAVENHWMVLKFTRQNIVGNMVNGNAAPIVFFIKALNAFGMQGTLLCLSFCQVILVILHSKLPSLGWLKFAFGNLHVVYCTSFAVVQSR